MRNTDEQPGANADDEHAAAAAAAVPTNELLPTPSCPKPTATEDTGKRRNPDEGGGEADNISAAGVQGGSMKRLRY